MTESRKKAMRKAKKQSAKPQPKVSFECNTHPLRNGHLHKGKIMWGKAGHAFSNKLLMQAQKKETFMNEVSYAR